MVEHARLRWLCRRGMKELDLVMTRYLDKQYAQANDSDQESFRDLLAMPDPDLYSLILGRQSASTSRIEDFAQTIRKMASQG